MLRQIIFLFVSFPLFIFSQSVDKVNLYLDCSFLCDEDYLIREMPFINFMREASDSHVQVLVNSENSASGGKRLSFRFIGLNEFEGKEDEYYSSIEPNASEEEERLEVLDMLQKGLLSYVLRSQVASQLKLEYTKIDSVKEDSDEDIDKWRNWIFSTNVSGWLNAEKGYKNQNYNSSISINKITDNIKFLSRFRLGSSQINYDYTDYQLETKTKSTLADFTFVKSVAPKFSVGALSTISRNTYSNYKLKFRFTPSIEYNIYPYKESSEHRLSLLYGVGAGYNDYIDSTIYLKTKETFPYHTFQFKFENIQKWGSLGLNLYGLQILKIDDMDKYYFNLSANVNWKVVKGLSLSFWTWATLNRAQISLVKGDVSSEDILTRQRELESNYSYHMNFGLSYTFGSTKNTIVNSRF